MWPVNICYKRCSDSINECYIQTKYNIRDIAEFYSLYMRCLFETVFERHQIQIPLVLIVTSREMENIYITHLTLKQQ